MKAFWSNLVKSGLIHSNLLTYLVESGRIRPKKLRKYQIRPDKVKSGEIWLILGVLIPYGRKVTMWKAIGPNLGGLA